MLELVTYEFMQRALVAALLLGVISGILSIFLVLKRYSMLGDGLSHASFGGIAFGFVAGIYPLLSAIVFAVGSVFIMKKVQEKFKIFGESAIALMTSFGMAFAIVLLSIADAFDSAVFTFLFGSLLSISQIEVYSLIALFFILLLFISLQYRSLLYMSFEEELFSYRVKHAKIIEYIFLSLVAVFIVLSVKAVGILLASALIVLPGLIGLKLGRSFKKSLLYSSISGILGVLLGLYFAYVFDIPTGATIVLSLLTLFISVSLWKNFRK